ncbi:MAG TPA: aromatic amino acid lyase [Caulobacteraceae bacterium]|jgi:histidine ammonia-lyase|nr:aromatic amino acid lyase [Caulobacteraceae bacterium]
MTVSLNKRQDINLDTLYRVAWQGEGVRLSHIVLSRIAASRESFLDLIENDSEVVIYGVTTAMGEFASLRLTPEQRDRHARIKPYAAATAFGDDLPDRVVRGMVLARLANFIEGHAATSPRIAMAVADMLDGTTPLPKIAASGHGGAGEIQALYPLFAELSARFDLEVRERGSLINGSPCAAALVGDAALAARRRYQTALKTFALSIEAFRAPLEHYDAALEDLWGDEHEAAALRHLRELLAGAGDGRRNYQAPVSYRIAPKVLGQAHRAVTAAERAATVSLSSVSDNPIYLPPDKAHPRGRCISTGGYHNAMAAPALDDLAAVWADLCQLAMRHCVKLLDGRASHMPDMLLVGREPGESDGRGNVGYLPWALAGYIEQAKAAAQTTFIPSTDTGGAGQDDVGTPAFHAFAKEAAAARCLDASLAMLAVISAQALHVTVRPVPPRLRSFVERVRGFVPPVVEDRVLGPELRRLTEVFTEDAFAVDRPLEQAAVA